MGVFFSRMKKIKSWTDFFERRLEVKLIRNFRLKKFNSKNKDDEQIFSVLKIIGIFTFTYDYLKLK